MMVLGSKPFGVMATRWLMVGLFAMGLMGLQSGRGTLAYFTAQVSSTGNTFTSGKIVLANGTFAANGANAILLQFNSTTLTGTCKNNDAVTATWASVVNNTLAGASPANRNMVPGDLCLATVNVS